MRDVKVRIVDKKMLGVLRRIQDHYEKMLEKGATGSLRPRMAGRCFSCRRRFKLGDKIVRIDNGVWYHEECYNRLVHDIPDSILDSEDWKIIEGDV